MKRLIPFRFDHRSTLCAFFSALVFTCVTGTAVRAQHAAGHVGVAPASHGASPRPVTPVRPPAVNPGTRTPFVRPPVGGALTPRGFVVGYPFPRRPIRPLRPIFPIGFFPSPGFGLFGIPFFGFGFGWGFESGYWTGCDPFYNWRYGCAGLPVYQYGAGDNSFSPGLYYPQPQIQIGQVYMSGADNPQFVDLYLQDGSVYNVTDYWVANGELHFKAVEEHGTKVVEHQIDFGLLDLQKTIDINTARGFRFVLRNEPLEQYLRDYPFTDSPNAAPAEPGSAEP